MKLKIAATILVVLFCAATHASSALARSGQTDGSLTKNKLMKMLLLNDSSQQDLIKLITQNGVNFQPTPTDERELHDAGASDDLIVSVRANYRNGATTAGGDTKAAQSNGQPGADQALTSTANGSSPAPKKKGLFSKLNQKMDEATAKLNKSNATSNQQTGNPQSTTGNPPAADNSAQATTPAATDNKSATQTSGAAPGNLAGTYWSLMSMTAKGETEKENSAPPDVEFCRDGKWGMLHYGGAREAGTYQIKGDRLIMKMEDGSLFGNFQIKRNGNEMTLDDGKYVLRMKYIHPAGC